MNAGKMIFKKIGPSALVGFGAKDLFFGRSDSKTHYGYLQFLVAGQPNLVENHIVKIELALNDNCVIRVSNVYSGEEVIYRDGINCSDLLNTLFEIIG